MYKMFGPFWEAIAWYLECANCWPQSAVDVFVHECVGAWFRFRFLVRGIWGRGLTTFEASSGALAGCRNLNSKPFHNCVCLSVCF